MAGNNERRTVDIILNGQQPARTLRELNQDIRIMTSSLRQLDINSPEWNVQAAQLQRLREQYQQTNNAIRNTGNSMSSLREQAKAIAIGTIGANLVTGITTSLTSYFSGVVDNLAKTSDQLANIRKTTNLTAEEIDKLDASFSKIDTRTSKTDLRNIAIIGGQLNVPTDQLLGFTEAIDKVTVALGDEFSGGAEQVTASLGKLRNILTDIKSDDYGTDLLNIGNALNELGNAGLATGPVVTDIATRIGSVGRQSGLTSGQIFGIAAAIQELGINSERGSTAVIRLLSKMKDNTKAFADVAGVSLKEFEELVNKDIFTALLKVAEGTKNASSQNTEFVKVLSQLETEGAGVQELLAGFSNNLDLVKSRAELSSTAISDTGSILNEFGLKNENAAGKIAKLGKEFAKLKDSQAIRGAIEGGINALTRFISFINSAGEFLSKYAFIVKGVIAALIIYNAALLKNLVLKRASIALDKAQTVIAAVLTTAIKGLILLEELWTGQITAKTLAQAAFNRVASLNPYVALATAIAAVTVATAAFINKQKEALKLQSEFIKNSIIDLNIKSAQSTSDKRIEDFKNAKTDEERAKIIEQAKEKEKASYQEIIKKQFEISELRDQLYKAQAEEEKLKFTVGKNNEEQAARERAEALKKQIDNQNAIKKSLEDSNQIYKNTVTQLEDFKKEKIETDKKLSEEELKAQKEAQEKYLQQLRDFNSKLEQLRRQSARAYVEAIDDELQRELKGLELSKNERIADAEATGKELVAQAKALGKDTSEVEKLTAQIKIDIEKKYQEDRKKIIDKFQKEIAETEYQQDIDNLAKSVAARQLILKRDFIDGKISKQQYEDGLADIEIDSKMTLIEILKDYQKDATTAEKELADAIIAIMEDKSAQASAIAEAEMNFRLSMLEIMVRKAQAATEQARSKGIGYKDALEEERRVREEYLKQQMESELATMGLTEEQKKIIKEKYLQDFAELETSYDQAQAERKISIAQFAFSQIAAFSDAIFSARIENIQRERDLLEQRYTAESEQIEKLKNQGILSETDYQKRKAVLEEQAAKKRLQLKRKEAAAEKTQALFSIAIQTAVNVLQAFPNVIMMAAAGALGALQAGIVAARPLPTYGKGTGSIVKGPSHNSRSKGLWLINPENGQMVALLEGDEAVLSKKTVENNRPIVDALLDSSMNNGGKSISKVPAYQRPLPSQNIGKWTSSIRTATMARGGYISTSSSATSSGNASNSAGNNSNDMYDLFQKIYSTLDKIEKNGVSGYWEYDRFKNGLKKYEDVNNRGNV